MFLLHTLMCHRSSLKEVKEGYGWILHKDPNLQPRKLYMRMHAALARLDAILPRHLYKQRASILYPLFS